MSTAVRSAPKKKTKLDETRTVTYGIFEITSGVVGGRRELSDQTEAQSDEKVARE